MWNALGSMALMAILAATPASGVTGSIKPHEQRIAIEVTSKGFVPSTIHVKAGEPIVLVVTRRTDRTCAKEIVIQERKIHRALPLNQAVEVRLKAQEPASLRYACGMNMVAGTLVIE
jgi:plastocyanin domain-containing protein